jgi:two-component system vancomycin resistance associated response regulator VraR
MAFNVIIVDDCKLIRKIFEDAIEGSQRYTIVGSAASAEEALELCTKRHVDIVLMDVVMGNGMDGITASGELKRLCPDVKILLVTSMFEVTYIRRAREAGVDSFWHKEVQQQPLLEVMDRTLAGEHIFPDDMPSVPFGNILSTELSEREQDILRGLVSGASNTDIAEQLGISERTVKMHITNLLQKTGFQTRLQLAVRARAGGIIINDG